MAKQPVTRMQIDAYRFGQRRLESALARRDPVLLHEVIRGQRRAVAGGLILATLIGLGLVAYVKLAGKTDWRNEQIINASPSGQMFVVIHQPDRLVPVPNLAAARLVYKAASNPKGGLSPLTGGAGGIPDATPMTDAQLVGAERTPNSALIGAPGAPLPSAGEGPMHPPGAWALCDTGGGNTQLIAGVDRTRPLGPQDGMLVSSAGVSYLVTGGRRYAIAANAANAALQAYDLRDFHPKPVSAGLLAQIPEGPQLGVPTWGVGNPASRHVVRVDRPNQAPRIYLVVGSQAAQVGVPVADLLRVSLNEDLSQPMETMSVDEINALAQLDLAPELASYPTYRPVIQDGPDTNVVCWQWGRDGKNAALSVAAAAPVPAGQPTTPLAQQDGPGPKLDAVSLPGGNGLPAFAVVPGGAGAGGYWLVSSTGVAYGIQDSETAQALGVQSPAPVPVGALQALPQGPRLDLADANQIVDVLRANPATGGG
jgi:type VII secretion protein EccB